MKTYYYIKIQDQENLQRDTSWLLLFLKTPYRSSHRKCSIKISEKRCSQKFSKIHRKTPVSESLFNEVAGLRPKARNYIKKDSLAQVFPLNFAKFLRTPFLQNTSRQLLLSLQISSQYKNYTNSDSLFCVFCWYYIRQVNIT